MGRHAMRRRGKLKRLAAALQATVCPTLESARAADAATLGSALRECTEAELQDWFAFCVTKQVIFTTWFGKTNSETRALRPAVWMVQKNEKKKFFFFSSVSAACGD